MEVGVAATGIRDSVKAITGMDTHLSLCSHTESKSDSNNCE